MDELRSPWSPPRRSRTARGIRPTMPISCQTFDKIEDGFTRVSVVGGAMSMTSPYAQRARPPSSASYGGRRDSTSRELTGREPSSRIPSAHAKQRDSGRNPFGLSTPMLSLVRSLRISATKIPVLQPSLSLMPTSQNYSHQHQSSNHRVTTPNTLQHHSSHISASFSNSVSLPRRSPVTLTSPSGSLSSPPASPGKGSAGLQAPDRMPSHGRSGSPIAKSYSEVDVYATQMAALVEHLQKRAASEQDQRCRVSPPGKAVAASARVSTANGDGTGAPRPSLLERERDNILHGQVSVAAMQQRLQHKFGEDAAAFMLHDMKQVPESLHVLFYLVIMQLRELPSPLPASLGEAYYAVFVQHFDRTVSAAERRHTTFRTQMAQLQVQTQVQLEAMQERVTELSPRGSRPTAQAQLQQLQRHVQQQAVEHQMQLKNYAAQAISALELHSQVMRLLCVVVAAQERLSITQLEAMGFEGMMQHLPAWEVLFYARDGALVMADPSLETWLMDKRVAKQFTADPRIGHAVLGHHYRQVAEQDMRALDLYGLRYAVLHLLLSDEEASGGERLLMDAEYMEQVLRCQEEGTLYLTLLRLTHKSEVVSEVLRWLRHNMGALRAFPRAVMALWQAAPARTLLARLVAAAEGRAAPHSSQGSVRQLYGNSTSTDTSPAPTVAVSTAAGNVSSSNRVGGAAGGSAESEENSSFAGAAGAAAAAAAVGSNVITATGGSGRGCSGAVVGSGTASSGTVLHSPRGTISRPTRPQCKLLNPPPFWPAAITHLPGHHGGVTGLVFDKLNRLLVAATSAGNVHVWDHATARCVGTLTGYSPIVPCIDMHPQGRLIAIGSSTECAVRVRDLDSGNRPLLVFSEQRLDPAVKTLQGQRNAVIRHLSYSPDGHLLAVVYGDGTVSVWDPVKGVRSSTMPVVNKGTMARYASFSPNGQLLALACSNGTIRVWHLERLNPLHISVLKAYEANVAIRAVHYSPSGLLLASLAEGSAEVALWDVATGNQLQLLQGQAGAATVRAIAFSPGGLLLATAGEDGEVCIWNASTRGQWFQAASLRGHAYAVNALAFSPCGVVLATGGNEDDVRLWDMGAILHRSEALRADSGYGLFAPSSSGVPTGSGSTAVGSLGSAGSSGVAVGVSGVHSHSLQGQQSAQGPGFPVTTIRGDEAASSGRHAAPGVISCLTHNPSGTQLAAGLVDGGVVVWDAVSPRCWVRLSGDHGRPVGRVVYSTDGHLLASASDDGIICVWNTGDLDVTRAHLVVTIHADTALGGGACDGGGGACNGGGDTDGLHTPMPQSRATTAWQAPAAANASGGASSVTRRHGPGAGGWVTLSCSVSLSPRGGQLASAHDDGTVLLWALPSGRLTARLQGHAQLAYGLQYSQDGRLLVTWSDDGTMCLWSPEGALRAAASEEQPEPVLVVQHRDHVYGVDFAPNNAPSLVSISRDGSMRVWDLRSGTCSASTPHGHSTDSKASIDGVRYSPTGLLLATWSSQDAVVRLWHAASCTLLRELSGLQLMGWSGIGPGPWAAVLRTEYAPFVVQLPERALLLEAAAIDSGIPPETSSEYLTAAADEAVEGLSTAEVGLITPSQRGSAAQRRREQLQLCNQLAFRPRDDPLAPVVGSDRGAPLRPSVRIFSATRSVPFVTLRGRSLVLADNCSTAFYRVTHDAVAAAPPHPP